MFNVGDKVRVIDNNSSHSYTIGRIVTVLICDNEDFFAQEFENDYQWWVLYKDCEPPYFHEFNNKLEDLIHE
jgi:hypothetical protein